MIDGGSKALLNRFLTEDCEKVDRIIRKRMMGGELGEKEKACLARLEKPISDREREKWQAREVTAEQASKLKWQRYAHAYFDLLNNV